MAKRLQNLHVCRALFRIYFQERLIMTDEDYSSLKKVSGLFPNCGYTYLSRLSYSPPDSGKGVKRMIPSVLGKAEVF